MLTIHVTRDHISKGVKKEPKGCPLSLALTDALDVPYRVAVGDAYFQYPDYGTEHALPREAIKFRAAFDNEKPVKPFSFRIADPRAS